MSHSSEGRKNKIKTQVVFGVCWEPASSFIDGLLFTVSSCSKKDKGVLYDLFCKGTNSIPEGSILIT